MANSPCTSAYHPVNKYSFCNILYYSVRSGSHHIHDYISGDIPCDNNLTSSWIQGSEPPPLEMKTIGSFSPKVPESKMATISTQQHCARTN